MILREIKGFIDQNFVLQLAIITSNQVIIRRNSRKQSMKICIPLLAREGIRHLQSTEIDGRLESRRWVWKPTCLWGCFLGPDTASTASSTLWLYYASKAAAHSISECLSMELKPFNISVFHVAPAAVISSNAINRSALPNTLYLNFLS